MEDDYYEIDGIQENINKQIREIDYQNSPWDAQNRAPSRLRKN